MGAYLHPFTGALTVLLLAYVGWLGLRLQNARRERAQLAARHARLAPWVYVFVLASWCAGAASTWALRDDLQPAASLHFRLGTLIVLLLSASAVTAYQMRRTRPAWRTWHPWFGAGALLAAAAHVVAGLRMMP
jgi:hypothetical protein